MTMFSPLRIRPGEPRRAPCARADAEPGVAKGAVSHGASCRCGRRANRFALPGGLACAFAAAVRATLSRRWLKIRPVPAMAPGLVPLLLIFIALLAGACADGRHHHERDLEDLEDRLLAPCCWRQSLRDHESELASALRAELRQRLDLGEPAGAIEEDLVRRYGDRIVTRPSGSDPRWMIIAMFSVAAGMGLFALLRLLRRGSAVAAASSTATRGSGDAELQLRLDEELTRID